MIRRLSLAALLLFATRSFAADPPAVIGEVEGQPLAQNAERVLKTLEFIGAPFEAAAAKELKAAIEAKDASAVQKALDKRVLFVMSINPEARVSVARGPAEARLQQAGFAPDRPVIEVRGRCGECESESQ